MDGSKCILQLRGVRPFLSDKYDITKHKNYKYLSDANPRYAFNIEKHVNRRLRVKANDEVELIDSGITDEDMPDEATGDFQTNADVDIVDDVNNAEFEMDLEPF